MKLTLDIEYDEEDEFSLIGISSGSKAYHLAWQIGKHLNFSFIKEKDIKLEFKRGKELSIVNYLYTENFSSIRLIKNKVDTKEIEPKPSVPSLFDDISTNSSFQYFIPELKKYDFLIKVEGEINKMNVDLLIDNLQQINVIQLSTFIYLDNIKSRQNLIFE